nr:MAG TPA: Super-infection exclusion protein B [Caudoviricetes sp.]
MEEKAKLLNTIITKVAFNHMTMFFVFLFIGFTLIPNELTLYLNPKTPAFFPDWFTLANFGSIVFALVSTMIWILLCNGIKLAFTKFHQVFITSSESDKLIKLITNLSELEKEILVSSCLGERIWSEDFKTKVAIEKLISLNLISHSWVYSSYEVNPLIKPFIISELDKVTKPHH